MCVVCRCVSLVCCVCRQIESCCCWSSQMEIFVVWLGVLSIVYSPTNSGSQSPKKGSRKKRRSVAVEPLAATLPAGGSTATATRRVCSRSVWLCVYVCMCVCFCLFERVDFAVGFLLVICVTCLNRGPRYHHRTPMLPTMHPALINVLNKRPWLAEERSTSLLFPVCMCVVRACVVCVCVFWP